jgi:hypothetical protein
MTLEHLGWANERRHSRMWVEAGSGGAHGSVEDGAAPEGVADGVSNPRVRGYHRESTVDRHCSEGLRGWPEGIVGGVRKRGLEPGSMRGSGVRRELASASPSKPRCPRSPPRVAATDTKRDCVYDCAPQVAPLGDGGREVRLKLEVLRSGTIDRCVYRLRRRRFKGWVASREEGIIE